MLSVNVSPFLVGIATYIVIVVMGGDLRRCKNSVTVKTCNVVGQLLMLCMVVMLKLAVKVRPVMNCGFNTRGRSHIGTALHLAVVTKMYVADANFLVYRLFPRTVSTVFADSRRLVSVTSENMHVTMTVFPLMNTRVIVNGFFRDVKGTGVDVFLSLAHRLLCLLPKLLVFPRCFKLSNV